MTMENKLASTVVNFIVRAVIGMGLIYLINQYLLHGNNTLSVGLNLVSFLTTGSLGIPGVCLLYGILIYQSL
ncbi:pro-sigmaK processing inhibitor BofA family protein [Clostridium sp. C105KSO13]|uniref:pro-sigmaK processing inhibitor BofA family protein n=1 Tax=Clostridium sp. C105KSO13 TaxID=1776045 RepID=UPI00325AAF33